MTRTSNKSQIINRIPNIDEELWEHVSASVKPLRSSQKNRVLKKKVKPTQKYTNNLNIIGKVPSPSRSKELFHPSTLPELSHEVKVGLDKKNAKKLKKGQHRIEGRLDLHGMTQDQAHTALIDFTESSYQLGKRCVLVITGKGFKSKGSIGVLRSAVPRWLNEEPNRTRVLAFSYAIAKDGGEGALYVMLKKKRQ